MPLTGLGNSEASSALEDTVSMDASLHRRQAKMSLALFWGSAHLIAILGLLFANWRDRKFKWYRNRKPMYGIHRTAGTRGRRSVRGTQFYREPDPRSACETMVYLESGVVNLWQTERFLPRQVQRKYQAENISDPRLTFLSHAQLTVIYG